MFKMKGDLRDRHGGIADSAQRRLIAADRRAIGLGGQDLSHSGDRSVSAFLGRFDRTDMHIAQLAG